MYNKKKYIILHHVSYRGYIKHINIDDISSTIQLDTYFYDINSYYFVSINVIRRKKHGKRRYCFCVTK